MERRQRGAFLRRLRDRLWPLAADPEQHRLNMRGIGSAVAREILARHDWRRDLDPLGAEPLTQWTHHLRGETGFVDQRGRVSLAEADFGHQRGRNARRHRLARHDPAYALVEPLALFIGERPHGELQFRGVGNDVVARSGVEAANGDHRGFDRVVLAADQRLEPHHDRTGQHDRIARGMRRRAVPANAAHLDIDTVDIGHRRAAGIGNHAGRRGGHVVEGKRVVRLGEAGVEPVVEHRLGALAGFFRWLTDHHQRARPVGPARRQQLRGLNPGGHVRVVPTRVHDAGLAAGRGRAARCAGEGETGLFDNRQCVHVGADHHRGTGAVLQHRHQTGFADTFGHGEARLARGFGHDPGAAHFLKAELGMLVQVAVDCHQPRHVGRYGLAQIVGLRGRGNKSGERDSKGEMAQHAIS